MMGSSLLLCVPVLVLFCMFWTSEGTLVGGQEPIKDVKDPLVQKAASFAVETLSKRSVGSDLPVLVSVVKGTSQVVAGVRYRLVLKVGTSSSCNRRAYIYNRPVSGYECPVDKGTVKEWYADVWVKPTHPLQYQLEDLHLHTGD